MASLLRKFSFLNPQPCLIDTSEVDCANRKKGYTKAADMWSLGVLTAALLTGSSVVPREELMQLSQVQIVDRLFGGISEISSHWQDIPSRALNFLRGLLLLDPDKRLTATSALNHSWFKKPLSEAALLEERYEKVIRFWRQRGEDEVIEYLPGRAKTSQEDQLVTSAPNARRKVPDINPSAYFGLDRHLQPKIASKRKMILDTLNESGSPFLVAEQSQHKTPIFNGTIHMGDVMRIETVKGLDLFGSLRSSQATNHEKPDLDEICLVPTTPIVHHSGSACGSNMRDAWNAQPSTAGATEIAISQADVEARKHKRSRRESEDTEERNFRDGVAKDMPRYSTAKALKEAVERRKQEMKSKTLTGLVFRSSMPTV